jgi:hypothetical protein
MAKLAVKHFNQESLGFVDFSGGLQLSKPPESIEQNEMQAAKNFEFAADTGLLKVRGGLEPIYNFDYPIRDIFPVAGGNAALVRAGDSLYHLVGGVAKYLGEVDGDLPGTFEYFGEQGDVAMVFGAHLFLFDNSAQSLKKVESIGSPTAANSIYYRSGRIAVTQIGSDEIKYSGIGDPEQWEHDPENMQRAQFVTVGYLDGCMMAAIGQMVGEVIVFKCPPGQPDNGIIYRLQGEPGNWAIIQHSKGASAWNSNALTVVANNMLFITREGMSSLATAMEYGDFRLAWAGAKINPKIALQLNDKCRLWHIPIKGQVWLWDGHSRGVWVYHYQIGEGAWTTYEFPEPPQAAAAVNNRTYFGMGNTVYELNEASTADNITRVDTGETSRVNIDALWMPKTLVRPNQILVKKIRTNYLSTDTANPRVNIEGFIVPLPAQGTGDIAAADKDILVEDFDPLVPSTTYTSRIRCNIRRWDVTPMIEVTNGLFQLSSLHLDMAEV